MAIAHANTICDWQENLPGDEMPPSWMWHLDAELEVWFENVKQARNDKYGLSDEAETVPMTGNDLAADMRRQ